MPGCLYLPLRTENGTAQRKTFRDRGPGRGSGQPAEASKARETAGKNPSGVGFWGGEGGGGDSGAREYSPTNRVAVGHFLGARLRAVGSSTAPPSHPAPVRLNPPSRGALLGEQGAVRCSGPPIPRSAHPRTRAQCIPRRRIAENSAASDAAPRSVARAAAARTAAAAVRVTGHDCSHEVTSRGVTAVDRVTAAAAGLPASRSA